LNDKEAQPEVAGFDATVAVEVGRSPGLGGCTALGAWIDRHELEVAEPAPQNRYSNCGLESGRAYVRYSATIKFKFGNGDLVRISPVETVL
jgi:hypothetical protein